MASQTASITPNQPRLHEVQDLPDFWFDRVPETDVESNGQTTRESVVEGDGTAEAVANATARRRERLLCWYRTTFLPSMATGNQVSLRLLLRLLSLVTRDLLLGGRDDKVNDGTLGGDGPSGLAHLSVESSTESLFVLGPTRGHAADLANVLLRRVFGLNRPCAPADEDADQPAITATSVTTLSTRPSYPKVVLLGDYIDGGVQSTETLAIVLLLRLCLPPSHVVLLKGRHELLFPVPKEWTAPLGRFDEELRHRCVR